MQITVVGSINLDLIVTTTRLPVPGETLTNGRFVQAPGGKGANQALAAARLGAEVALVGMVGDDQNAASALAMLVEAGFDLDRVGRSSEAPTGVALIMVGEDGENQIVVAPGANRLLRPGRVEGDAVICQLEIPLKVVVAAAEAAGGLFVLNAAPARELPDALIQRCDLLVVNVSEAEFYGDRIHLAAGTVAVTRGGDGAMLLRHGRLIAEAVPPSVTPIDTVGAGDCFVAALTVGLLEGMSPQDALEFAVTAGALATTRSGAQPAMPWRSEVDQTRRGSFSRRS